MKRLTLCAVVLSLLAPSGAFAAVPDFLTKFPEDGLQGEGAGQLFLPRGIAADPSLPGDVYVSDGANGRISEFTPWGEFVKAWGWGVDTGLAKFEICTQASGCQKGIEGDGAGQIEQPEGIAVDSEGGVYVAEAKNSRVQKFDSAGNFILMFGLDVNKTKVEGGGTAAERNVCTAASGDLCQAGTPGSGPGQFVASLGSYNNKLAVSPIDKTVFVGELDGERIQAFNPDGSFKEEIALPAGKSTDALAIDTAGILYTALSGEPEVRKLKPSGPTAEFLTPSFAAEQPGALAVTPTGNLFVVVNAINVPPPKVSEPPKVLEFDPSGKCLNCGNAGEGGKAGFDRTTDSDLRSIAVGSACGPSDIYVTHFHAVSPPLSFLKAFGEPPSPTICPPPVRPPEIGAQYAASVGTTDATLRAQINPRFWPDTTYYVQYGTGKCSEGGCDKEQPLAPGAKLTDQTTSQFLTTAGVFLAGLAPDTTYHYRFVATSPGGGPVRGSDGSVGSDGAEATLHTFPLPVEPKKDCLNQAFRTAISATLPDCRAYEMVSPINKEGGEVASGRVTIIDGTLAASAADGSRTTYSSLRAFADPKAAPLVNQYLSVRGAEGWMARSITPPRADPPIYGPGASGQFKSFDEELCTAWLMQDSNWPLVSEPTPPDGVANLYKRQDCSEGELTADTYELISTVDPPGFGSGELAAGLYLPVPQGHSADETKTVYRADAKLTSNACATPGIFQVYLAGSGPLRLVSILPPEGSSQKATCNHATVGTMEGFNDDFREASLHHAISADGERVFWTDSSDSVPILDNGFPGRGPGTLYLRLNAAQSPSKVVLGECTEAAKACTVAVSAGSDARFWDATPEGTKALLTAGDELREYDVAAEESLLIANGVSGVIGSSEDLSRIYFISNAKLSGEQENSEGAQAVAGQPNVYLAEGGAGGTIVFVGRLLGGEGNGYGAELRPSSPANIRPYYRTSRVSPDGLVMAFTSTASLTGYDNTDRASGEPDTELFLYDAEVGGGVGELICVSCNPGNARPAGREIKLVETYGAAALLPGWAESLKPTRLLSADGNHLYFESFDALVLRDTNGRKDVYQWERASSKAACDQAGADVYSPEAGGCLSLISSGQSAEDSELIDASEGGQDVFFTTASSLLPQDPGLIDVYDARQGGGYPPPPTPQPACEGEACQGPLEAPNDPTPASASFQGAGNVVEKAKKKHKPKKKHHKQQGKKHKKSQKQAKYKRRSAR